jgi:hypothetical protein
MRTRRAALTVIGVALACFAITGAGSSIGAPTGHHGPCPLPQFGPGSSYHPQIDPRSFTPNVDNPYFPLPVGTTYLYSGTKDGAKAIDVVQPSRRTRVIEGVRTRVVSDRLFLNGTLRETTQDYYAQDRCGNVWYFGEDTAELDAKGHVISREGSFLAGSGGAQPGVFMQAHPQLGRAFRQEWLPGEAEDVFSVIDLHARATVPYGSFRAIRTKETTALEPGVVDNKLFVRGIGEVQEQAVKGGSEKLVLVDVLR